MRLVFHILLKDLRRQWREIVLFLVAAAGCAAEQAHPAAWAWLSDKYVAPVLFYLLWFFIVIRVVQGEPLAGDTHLWTTRPYRWWQLLAAKAIFLVLCLHLPPLAMDVYQLESAGFHFTAGWVPGLLVIQITSALVFTLPAAAVATVTESLTQWLIAAVCLGVVSMFFSWIPWGSLPVILTGVDNNMTILGSGLLGAAMIVAIVCQYARRNARYAFWILGGAVLAIPVLTALESAGFVRNLSYPLNARAPFRLSIPSSREDGGREYSMTAYADGSARISVPYEASTVSPDGAVVIEGTRFELKGDNGWHWESEWEKWSGDLTGEESRGSLDIDMPENVAKQVGTVHATASVELALSQYRLGPWTRIETGGEKFEIPGGGRCQWHRSIVGDEPSKSGLDCAAPVMLPDILVAHLDSGENTCQPGEKDTPLPQGHRAISVEVADSPASQGGDWNPIPTLRFSFPSWFPAVLEPGPYERYKQAYLCQGTPLHLREGALGERMRVRVDLGSLGTEAKPKPAV